MKRLIWTLALVGTLVCCALPSSANAAFTIAAEQIDDQKIYYGSASSFEKPAMVDYNAVVKATPEYAEIKKKKIEAGTARYWILMSSASEHAVRAIGQVGKETDHDLICAVGYLGNVTPPIEAVDVTEQVLKKFGNTKTAKAKT